MKQTIGRLRSRAAREVEEGAALRAEVRRRKSRHNPLRVEALEAQIERLSEVGRGLRPFSSRLAWGQFEFTHVEEKRLLESSAAVQRERRKLRKMLP